MDEQERAREYRLFIIRYRFGGRDELESRLSVEDIRILDEWANSDEAEVAIENKRIHMDKLDFCAWREGRSAIEQATRYARIFEDWGTRVAEKCEQRINRLSPAGTRTIEEFIAEFVRPRLGQRGPSDVERAREEPRAYLSHLDLVCHVEEKAELPPEVQKVVEAKFPQFGKPKPGDAMLVDARWLKDD